MGMKLSLGLCTPVFLFIRKHCCRRPSQGLAFAVKPRFVSLTQSEAKQTEPSEFGAQKGFLIE